MADKEYKREDHKSSRSPWLRAAVLGVNDGIVSTSSLMLGVAAAQASGAVILTAGIAGLVAGAASMAIGEYVSVSSQRDSEKADLELEAWELKNFAEDEEKELAQIYERKGLKPELAAQVARQLHEHDALAAHAQDELGIDHKSLSNPILASVSSAVSFAVGAAVPIAAALVAHGVMAAAAIVGASLLALALSGAAGAYIGGGGKRFAALRVLIGGGAAMAVTAWIGSLVGAAL
ncbi:MAG TPA: VIT family protein [Candidatus Saccharimonas sp.]|nr:VIT family protein [Candidatus Saccharimonas sp.]